MKHLMKFVVLLLISIALVGCGAVVDVPAGHVAKVVTAKGYAPKTYGTSTFRLNPCLPGGECERAVLLDVTDIPFEENMSIFMPTDKLHLNVTFTGTMSINPAASADMFTSLRAIPVKSADGKTVIPHITRISALSAYDTYAKRIITTIPREYITTMDIATVSSSLDAVNAEIVKKVSAALPKFHIRHLAISSIKYPDVIADAQENAARRREAIEQETAQKEVDKVKLERQLQETRLQRLIDVEQAAANAQVDRLRAKAARDPAVIKLRELEIQAEWIKQWNGDVPQTYFGSGGNNYPLMLNMTPQPSK